MNWDIIVQCTLSCATFLFGFTFGVVAGAIIALRLCRSEHDAWYHENLDLRNQLSFLQNQNKKLVDFIRAHHWSVGGESLE